MYPIGKALTTLIITMILLYPTIVSLALQDFRCVEVDGESRLLEDFEVLCWSSSHTLVSLAVAIPSLIVWAFGVPLLWFLFISTNKKDLSLVSLRKKLGFVYFGYKKEFYFWEIIITYRKALIIFISVYLTTFGVIA